jgi:hypothetical protein
MPDSVRVRFEEAYFRDDALLDRIEAEEDLLVTDYVLGRLTETDRRRFEGSLLGMPYYQDRVRTTSQLNLRVARLKFRPPRPKETRRAAEKETERLFPGRSGSAVAFAVLAVLLAAALVTAVKLRSELEKRSAIPPAPIAAAAATTDALVFDALGETGPRLRRFVRDEHTSLLVGISRRLIPPATREWRLMVLGADGTLLWEGPVQRLTDVAPGADLSARLPPGVPAVGRSALVLKAGGLLEDALVPLGLLEIEGK